MYWKLNLDSGPLESRPADDRTLFWSQDVNRCGSERFVVVASLVRVVGSTELISDDGLCSGVLVYQPPLSYNWMYCADVTLLNTVPTASMPSTCGPMLMAAAVAGSPRNSPFSGSL